MSKIEEVHANMIPPYIDFNKLDFNEFSLEQLEKIVNEAQEQIALFKLREDHRIKIRKEFQDEKLKMKERLLEEEDKQRELLKKKDKHAFEDSDEDSDELPKKKVIKKKKK